MVTIDFSQPQELENLRSKIEKILHPINKVTDATRFIESLPFNAKRTDAGRKITSYYLVYFLLVDLMEFKNDGQFDKVAWSVRIEYKGIPFVVEHRKMGIGVFGSQDHEKEAAEITERINKAVEAAEPYFDFLAAEAAKRSALNVVNKSSELFERYRYFLGLYKLTLKKINNKKAETSETFLFPSLKLYKTANWNAIAALDAFFSWTEHVFILIAILRGTVKTGEEVANLADRDWPTKFKTAISIDSEDDNNLYQELLQIRRQIRNFIAHGSFGKQGEAFQFHSGAGAVPMMLPHQQKKARFTFIAHGFNDKDAFEVVDKFINLMWTGDREPARIYIQDNSLPLILTMAADGQYKVAMESTENMHSLIESLHYIMDRNADMDF